MATAAVTFYSNMESHIVFLELPSKRIWALINDKVLLEFGEAHGCEYIGVNLIEFHRQIFTQCFPNNELMLTKTALHFFHMKIRFFLEILWISYLETEMLLKWNYLEMKLTQKESCT